MLSNGFSNLDLRHRYMLLLGKQPDATKPGTDDLATPSFRLRGFIVRIPKSPRHEVTAPRTFQSTPARGGRRGAYQ